MLIAACTALLALSTAVQSVALSSRPAARADTGARLPKAAPAPAGVRAVRATAPVVLDGVLTDAAWQQGVEISDFHQREPNEGAAPTERTTVYVLYDDAAIYIGARMWDSHPDSIQARLSRRDNTGSSDDFIVYLDPYLDRRTGFYFGLSAAGTPYDGTLMNDDWNDDTWDGVWEGKVSRDSAGWTAEFRIPYSQLRFQRKDVQTWGINFKRDIARLNEQDYLAYTPRTGSGFVSRFPMLSGIERITPPRHLEILPYATARAEFGDHTPGDPFNDGSRYAPGIGADAKLGLGSNLTLDATVNPDFGQVEVDPAVVNLSDFETFFQEKRPFFIEGANTFEFGSGGANNNWGFNFGTPSFFYSRRIGRAPQGATPSADFSDTPTGTHILGALKLSGKLGNGWNVGAIEALTRRESASLFTGGTRSSAEVEPLASYSVARAQREFNGGRQGLGFISTLSARRFDDPALRDQVNSNSAAVGMDGWTFLDKDRMWVLTGWVGGSRVAGTPERMIELQTNSIHRFQRPDVGYLGVDSLATSLAGWAGRVALNKQKGEWSLNAALGAINPGFELNDLGFQWNGDVINGHVVVGHKWTTPNRITRRITFNTAVFRSMDFGGNTTWQGSFTQANIQFANYWRMNGFFAYNPQSWNKNLTRGGPLTLNPAGWETNVFVSSDERKPWVFGGGVHFNNYKLDSNDDWSVDGSVEWKPASNISLSVEPSYQKSYTAAQYLQTVADPSATATFGQRYVFGSLLQKTLSASVRLNWTFSPRTSLQLYAQPLVSSGAYTDFKSLARPKSYDFEPYAGDVGNPDFTFASLRGNAVLRWEYLPGSTLFLVWTQSRANSEDIGTFGLRRSLGNLFDVKGTNTFLVKVSYWWNPR
jgi:hypothetical protein